MQKKKTILVFLVFFGAFYTLLIATVLRIYPAILSSVISVTNIIRNAEEDSLISLRITLLQRAVVGKIAVSFKPKLTPWKLRQSRRLTLSAKPNCQVVFKYLFTLKIAYW